MTFLWLLTTSASLVICTASLQLDILECSQQGKIFFPGTKRCHLPFSKEPCADGQVLAASRDRIGKGVCKENPCEDDLLWTGEKCVDMYGESGCNKRGQRLLYNLTGGVECDCEEGWGKIKGVDDCYPYATKGSCDPGHLLLKSNNQEHCNCIHHQSCPSFMEDLRTLSQLNRSSVFYKEGVVRLKGQKCGNQLNVCCREKGILSASLQLSEVLDLISQYHRLNLACAQSPCTAGSRPWLGGNDCLPLDENAKGKDCALEVEDNVLKCEEDLADRNIPMAYRHKCLQGRIWSRFRRKCVKNFF